MRVKYDHENSESYGPVEECKVLLDYVWLHLNHCLSPGLDYCVQHFDVNGCIDPEDMQEEEVR